jgi:hypothetical protein
MYELPLGSIASAWSACLLSAVTLLVLLLARHYGLPKLQDSDIPALLALVPGGIAVTGSLFQGSEPSSSAVLAKVSLVACSLMGVAFASWWIYTAGKATSDPRERNHLARWTLNHGGQALLAAAGALFVIVTIRAFLVVWTFQRVQKGERPFSMRRLIGKTYVKMVLRRRAKQGQKGGNEVVATDV